MLLNVHASSSIPLADKDKAGEQSDEIDLLLENILEPQTTISTSSSTTQSIVSFSLPAKPGISQHSVTSREVVTSTPMSTSSSEDGSGDDLVYDDITLDDYITPTVSIDVSAEVTAYNPTMSGDEDDVIQWETTQITAVAELPFTDMSTHTKLYTIPETVPKSSYITSREQTEAITEAVELDAYTTTATLRDSKQTITSVSQPQNQPSAMTPTITSIYSRPTSSLVETTQNNDETAPTVTSQWWWRSSESPSTTRFVWWWTSTTSQSTTTATSTSNTPSTKFVWWWTTKADTQTENIHESTTPATTEKPSTTKFVWWWTSTATGTSQSERESTTPAGQENFSNHHNTIGDTSPMTQNSDEDFGGSSKKPKTVNTTTISNHVQDNLGTEHLALQNCDQDKSGICDMMDEQKCRLVLFQKLCCKTCLSILYN